MNRRERIIAILNREPVDRMPVDLWHTPEIESALKAHFGAQDDFSMWRALDLDKIVWVFMEYRAAEGESRGSQVGAQASGSRTMWGVPLKEICAGEASYQEFVEPPMAGYERPSDIERYPYWPDPQRFDYRKADELARRAAKEFAVIGPWVSFFEIYCQLRGIERALTDLANNPALVEATLDRIEEIQTDMMRRFFERSADVLDMTFISDDIGGQNGLLLSPQMWRTHLEPRMKRWCDLIHSHGIRVFYHSDGGFNFAHVADATLDGWLDAAATTTAGRDALYAQIQRAIMEQALVLPLRDYVNLNVARAEVQGLHFDAQGWFPWLIDVRLGEK